MNLARLFGVTLIAVGMLFIDGRRHRLHVVAGVIFILAGLLFFA